MWYFFANLLATGPAGGASNPATMLDKLLPYDVAHYILGEFNNYLHQFKGITKRARVRFEQRDWHGIQSDARERLILYRDFVGATTDTVRQMMGARLHDRPTWRDIKRNFELDIENYSSKNIAETYFNSVFRHIHKGLSVDEELMFVQPSSAFYEFQSIKPIYHIYPGRLTARQIVTRLLDDFTFDVPWENRERDIHYITQTIERELLSKYRPDRQTRLEVLKSVFFRNKGAYIVGRAFLGGNYRPFILPLLNEGKGVYVDALLLEEKDISTIFSYNRSYFLVDADIPSELVGFLKTILPYKSLGELYNSIGFVKHGKTELYRDYLRHLERSDDLFEEAPGIPGMVMSVFHLPSYNMVFKVIKDRFAPPKKTTHRQVEEKYHLVSLHDRVGRMADTQQFENFIFPRKRFSEPLIQHLLQEAPSKIVLSDDTIEIKHLYIEKKMIPLNIYLEKASPKEAEEVILDYGRAIKQLAAANIFPGDMLLKNFGVTRLNRVVFYDYDEIGLLTDYNFRTLPPPRDFDDEMAAEPWYSVAENDVFPEEFKRFLIGRSEIREIFFRLHADLFDARFWRQMQEKQRRGEIVDVFPYRRRVRFRNVFGDSCELY